MITNNRILQNEPFERIDNLEKGVGSAFGEKVQ